MVAFDAIYNLYCHKLHLFVIRYLKQEEDAEEIIQDVFVKIWENRNQINTHASFESFLFTISYNSTISLLRKRLNERKSREYLKSVQQIHDTYNVIDDLHYKELNKMAQSLIEQLTPRQKEIYTLSREKGMTHKEIAEQLNISENTVKNHLVSILKFLKSNMHINLIANYLVFCLFF